MNASSPPSNIRTAQSLSLTFRTFIIGSATSDRLSKVSLSAATYTTRARRFSTLTNVFNHHTDREDIKSMYTVSNRQMDYIKQYIAIMIDRLTPTDTRSYNQRRMANNLLQKLEAKQPLPASALSDIKRINLGKKCLQCKPKE